ncbi:MAG: hypothetical protein AAFZ52_16335, partial [Bacteroidota bacterium]
MTRREQSAALWQAFRAHLINEWPRRYQRRFGSFTSFTALPEPYNFARTLHQHITRDFAERGVKSEVVSVETLHNALQRDGLTGKEKTKSLDFYTCALGYRNWDDFRLQLPRQAPAAAPPEPLPTPVLSPKVNPWWWLAGSLLGLSLLYGVYFFYQSNRIKARIQAYIAAEFNAYRSVPVIDTAYFSDFLVAEAAPRGEVMYVLQRAIKNGRRLRIPPSTGLADRIRVTYVGWSTAYVKTTEKWYNLWYDEATNKDVVKYDVINEQDYTLVWEDGRWKVRSNLYQGDKEV